MKIRGINSREILRLCFLVIIIYSTTTYSSAQSLDTKNTHPNKRGKSVTKDKAKRKVASKSIKVKKYAIKEVNETESEPLTIPQDVALLLEPPKDFIRRSQKAIFLSRDFKSFEDYFFSEFYNGYEFTNHPEDIPLDGVLISYVVNSKGYVSEIIFLKSVGPRLKKGITKIFLNSPKWSPAEINNKAVLEHQMFVLDVH